MSTSRPGEQVYVRIPWRAWTTTALGLVAAQTPEVDAELGLGRWQLIHEPSGLVIAYFDDPEQVQAAASKLTGYDWPNLDLNDKDALKIVRDPILDACRDLGGEVHPNPPVKRWADVVAETRR